jgi:hypothetical protein
VVDVLLMTKPKKREIEEELEEEEYISGEVKTI